MIVGFILGFLFRQLLIEVKEDFKKKRKKKIKTIKSPKRK